MQVKTDGLVIREWNVGESDRLVSVLTRDEGVIRAFARQAKRLRSAKASSTQLLCYSHMSLYKGRDAYIIDEAQPVELFFGLRKDIERLSLAQYFCELAGTLAPEEMEAGDFLRLMLNALHFLSKGTRSPLLLKSVVEMRMMSLAGYMPGSSAPFPGSTSLRCSRSFAAPVHPAAANTWRIPPQKPAAPCHRPRRISSIHTVQSVTGCCFAVPRG